MQLEIGDSVRYQGLGTGRVLRHEEREFRGEQRVFAVISFPHREMTAQLPLGDPVLSRKLHKVLSRTACQRLVKELREPGDSVARTWDQREEQGTERLRNGGPQEWAALLRAYARARGEGMSVSASDAELVRQALELLSSELSSAADVDYDTALSQVRAAYEAAIEGSRASAAEHAEAELQPA